MLKCRLDAIFLDTNEHAASKDVELPTDTEDFLTILQNAEQEIFEEKGSSRTVSVHCVTALEDCDLPTLNGNGPISSGDVVWRDWDDVSARDYDVAQLRTFIKEYKPLWRSGPGYEHLVHMIWP